MNDHLTHERDPFAARVGLGLRELDGLEQAPDVSEAVRRRLAGAGRSSLDQPRRRPVLLLLAALLALAVTATLMWQARGGGAADEAGQVQDPQAVQLVYRTAEAPEAAQREELLEALRHRLGDLGTAACEGRTVTITLAAADQVQQARALVEGQHRFAMRMLADNDYAADAGVLGGEVRFDLGAERARLQAWLDDGGAVRVRADPAAIRDFKASSQWLRWIPHLVRPRTDEPGSWSFRLSDAGDLGPGVVFVGDEADWNGGRLTPQQRDAAEPPFLVELVAINMHEWHVDADTIDPNGVRLAPGREGLPAVRYALRQAERRRYGDLSEHYVGKCMAILWNDQVLSAPRFLSRIPGVGVIEGLSPKLAEELVRVFRTPLPVSLEFVR